MVSKLVSNNHSSHIVILIAEGCHVICGKMPIHTSAPVLSLSFQMECIMTLIRLQCEAVPEMCLAVLYNYLGTIKWLLWNLL